MFTHKLALSLVGITATVAGAVAIARSSTDTTINSLPKAQPFAAKCPMIDWPEALRSQGCWIPIILITAFPNGKHLNRVLESGALGFLSKPFDEVSLIRCLTAAIGSRT